MERVHVEAVADLPGEVGEAGIDACDVDRDLWLLYRARVEERRHEGVAVEVPLEVQRPLGLERLPDRTQGQDVLAQPRDRPVPGHREAAGYVGPDLRAEAQHEASIREVLEVPGRLGRLHRGAREGDGYTGAQLYLMGFVRGYGQGQEGVVFGLAGPQAGEAKFFGRSGGPVHTFQVISLCPEAGVELHGIVLRDK
jgi:hypothetical protein